MDHYSDGPSHFIVDKGPGRTVIFLSELFREVDNEACILVYILLWCKGEYIRCLFTFVLRVEVDTVYRKS